MKNRKVKITLIACMTAVLCPAIIYGLLNLAMYAAGFMQPGKNIEYQDRHLEYLKTEYYSDSYTPCNEQSFADFNIEEAISEGVKINEISVIGTHNSYQTLATPQKRFLEKVRNVLSGGEKGRKRDFEMETYTEQLEKGIRNLEIDVITVDDGRDVSFVVEHNPVTDNASSAYDFAKGLEEIVLWSDNNPGHLPVYLLIEPKSDVPAISNKKNFTAEYARRIDIILSDILGERMMTPAQVLGDYGSFKEMREADGWPELKKASGKFIVLLHPCDVTQEYIDGEEKTERAMFPVLRTEDADKDYAAFIIDNEPESAVRNNPVIIAEKNLMVRTRADSYPNFSDERYNYANSCGSHIITTDYPPRSVRMWEHTYTFDGYTVKLLK